MNYYRRSIPYKNLKNFIPDFLKKIDINRNNRFDLFLIWKEIVGENIANMTEFIYIKKSILFVVVRSSSLYSILKRKDKRIFLNKIKNIVPKLYLKDIEFILK